MFDEIHRPEAASAADTASPAQPKKGRNFWQIVRPDSNRHAVLPRHLVDTLGYQALAYLGLRAAFVGTFVINRKEIYSGPTFTEKGAVKIMARPECKKAIDELKAKGLLSRGQVQNGRRSASLERSKEALSEPAHRGEPPVIIPLRWYALQLHCRARAIAIWLQAHPEAFSREIQERFNWSHPTVEKHVGALINAGLVTRTKRRNTEGQFDGEVYRISEAYRAKKPMESDETTARKKAARRKPARRKTTDTLIKSSTEVIEDSSTVVVELVESSVIDNKRCVRSNVELHIHSERNGSSRLDKKKSQRPRPSRKPSKAIELVDYRAGTYYFKRVEGAEAFADVRADHLIVSRDGWTTLLKGLCSRCGLDVPDHLTTPFAVEQANDIVACLTEAARDRDLHLPERLAVDGLAWRITKALKAGKTIRSFGFIVQRLIGETHGERSVDWAYDANGVPECEGFDAWLAWAGQAAKLLDEHLRVDVRALATNRGVAEFQRLYRKHKAPSINWIVAFADTDDLVDCWSQIEAAFKAEGQAQHQLEAAQGASS